MDMNVGLVVFLLGTFVAACVTRIAGFAFGLIAAAIWLHALTPQQATPLIVAYALIVQGYAVWKLRGSLNYRRLWPLILGSSIGVPLGVGLLALVAPIYLRLGVGALLVLFSLYSLLRPTLPQFTGVGLISDISVGVLNGILGGATALAGIALVI